ncbi:DUF1120 domain-containing protein [Pandoraea sp. NPDC087047]|uniref:DUF1120 domain-containing protein n=1 Tax=Pandoraea sp. NPDC087047 TaxID=3364390 RepID=UPI00381AAEDB
MDDFSHKPLCFLRCLPESTCAKGTDHDEFRQEFCRRTVGVLVVLAVLVTTSSVAWTQSVDMTVVGTIAPTGCKPALTDGGATDYGVILPGSLKRDSINPLEKRQLELTITCNGPVKVALRAINGRPSPAGSTTEGMSGDHAKYVVGLGGDGSRKVGGYNMNLRDVTLDSQPAEYLLQRSGSTTWEAGSPALTRNEPFLLGFGLPGALEPAAFTTLTGKLNVQVYINKASELGLTKPLKLDGLIILELLFL